MTVKHQSITFFPKERFFLFRLQEFLRLDYELPPKYQQFDPDDVRAVAFIDYDKKLIVVKFADFSLHNMLNCYITRKELKKLSAQLIGISRLKEGDVWNEDLGIDLAKHSLLKKFSDYVISKLDDRVKFAKNWIEEAGKMASDVRVYLNKKKAMLDKVLTDINEGEEK